MQCPKCKTEARDVARFCPRCHATLLYQCPSCHHEQRRGGTCEKCGVDFLKYFHMLLASKRLEADGQRQRVGQRSTLLKDILMIPFNMGIPLIRNLLAGPRGQGPR